MLWKVVEGGRLEDSNTTLSPIHYSSYLEFLHNFAGVASGGANLNSELLSESAHCLRNSCQFNYIFIL